MQQSLPDLIAIYIVPCSHLYRNITERYLAHLPVVISPLLTSVSFCGNTHCDAEQQYESGGYSEKTVLQFNTTEDIAPYPPSAFVVTDAQNQSYIIGTFEKPYPIVEISRSIDRETNVNSVKVTFTRQKSLVPCVI